MKLFNLTDMPTPVLEKHGLVRQVLVVRSTVIPPGASAEVENTDAARREAKSYVRAGAMAIDILPSGYVLAKERAAKGAK